MAQSAAQKAAFQKMLASRKSNPMKKAGPTLAQVFAPKKKAKTYKGKSMVLGGGGQFLKMQDAIVKKGKTPQVAAAITASIGIKKLGQVKMTKLATAGKKRAAKKK
jgi:hypothetical protein